jgi:excisionase family DNA binding protein
MAVTRQLSVLQVSAKLQCSPSTVRKLIADGALRASRVTPRTIRISDTDLQAYLDSRSNVPPGTGASGLQSMEGA